METPAGEGQVTLLKKISPKTVLGKKIEKPETETPLYRVVGVCSGLKTGSSTYGEWVGFLGEFTVIRADGAVFGGTKLFLPDPAQTLLVTAVKGLQDKTSLVEIALDIGYKPSDAPIGYEYTVKPLLAVKASTPLQSLLARLNMGPAPAQLEAPKSEAQPASAPASQPASAPASQPKDKSKKKKKGGK